MGQKCLQNIPVPSVNVCPIISVHSVCTIRHRDPLHCHTSQYILTQTFHYWETPCMFSSDTAGNKTLRAIIKEWRSASWVLRIQDLKCQEFSFCGGCHSKPVQGNVTERCTQPMDLRNPPGRLQSTRPWMWQMNGNLYIFFLLTEPSGLFD